MAKIFLTGVTGLVGSAFVTALLKDRPDTEFLCLSRGGKNRTPQERVESALRDQCIFDNEPERFDEVMRHITVIPGDVVDVDVDAVAADPRMADVEFFFHCAADVNLGKDPTGKTYKINFHGTENMLAIARKLPKLKEFHYVSTAYVAGKTRGVAPEDQAQDNGFNNPYEESKFKAELLVRNSGFPFTIYRPAIITGRRGDGRIRRPLAFYRILEFIAKAKSHRCSKLKVDPTERVDINLHFRAIPSERVYFVPIDYVQEAITKAFQLPATNQTYHVTGDSPVTTMMIDEAVCDVIKLANVSIDLNEDREPTADEKLLERLLGDLFPYFSADVIFAQDNIRRAIGDEALNWTFGKEELAEMMRNYYRDFFPNTEWIKKLMAEN